ncbi:hypothetical protein [Rossellomorea marisflavi]|uniref:hypothetical protein n=1 Tax=Rossellomorea marisflavi TaxID=189381 RepID=UPI003459F4D6
MNFNAENAQLAEKHKRFFERMKITPFEFVKENKVYQRVKYFTFFPKRYSHYLFFPYDVSYEEAQDLFYQLILLDWYLTDPLDEVNKYASRDYGPSIYRYRKILQDEALGAPNFKTQQERTRRMIQGIDTIEENLEKIEIAYENYKESLKHIIRDKKCTAEDFRYLEVTYGEAMAYLFLQAKEQKEMVDDLKTFQRFMEENKELKRNRNDMYQITRIMTNSNDLYNLDKSLKSYGDYNVMREQTFEEIVEHFIQSNEKNVTSALDEKYMRKNVRNPSVQGVKHG